MQLRCCSTTVFLFKALITTAIIGVSKRSSLVVLPTATAFGVVSSSSLSILNPTSSLTTTQAATRLFSSSSNSMTTTTPDVSRFMTGARPSETKEYIMQQVRICYCCCCCCCCCCCSSLLYSSSSHTGRSCLIVFYSPESTTQTQYIKDNVPCEGSDQIIRILL